MGGNTFGTLFRITTFGESHGPALGVVIDGCPPGIPLAAEDFLPELARRRPGQSAVTTSRNEPDHPEILSGTFEGQTTGMPIAVIVRNVDQRPQEYVEWRHTPRPGHAEGVYTAKYGVHDWRGSGRASGRETVARVLAGVVARKVLPPTTQIIGHAVRIADITATTYDPAVIEQNPVRSADPVAARRMADCLLTLKAEGKSAGGIVAIRVEAPPKNLGEPVFDKLKADLAKAVVSIGSVMSVEFSGGIVAGISTGEPMRLQIGIKPTSTTGTAALEGRHDPCVVPRIIPVAEAMVAMVLVDHFLRQRALRGAE